jgi:hypothetical protein
MPKNKTRKSVNLIGNDPILQKIVDGTLLWGNVLEPKESPKGKPKGSPTRKSPNSNKNSPSSYYQENEALENYVIPDLSKRKGIWEHFPVILDRIADRNGKERYQLLWNMKNLDEWRSPRSKSMEEWMEYQAWAEYRLFHALRAHAHIYAILPPSNVKQIAILEMEGEPKAPNNRVPVLAKLNDIKEHFPVIWNKIPGRAGKSTYVLEIYGKKMRDISMKAGKNMEATVRKDLMIALKASKAWTVLPAVEKDEFCRLEIA